MVKLTYIIEMTNQRTLNIMEMKNSNLLNSLLHIYIEPVMMLSKNIAVEPPNNIIKAY